MTEGVCEKAPVSLTVRNAINAAKYPVDAPQRRPAMPRARPRIQFGSALNARLQRNAHMFQPHKAALERGSVLHRHADLLLETAERNPQRFRAVVRMARKRPESLGQVDFANLFETVIDNRRTISANLKRAPFLNGSKKPITSP